MPKTSRNPRLLARYVTASITVELDDALQHIALQERRTKANVVRLAINEYIRNWNERNPEIMHL